MKTQGLLRFLGNSGSKGKVLTAALPTAVFFVSQAVFAYSGTYTDIKAFMQDLVTKHPDTTHLVTVGQSDSGDVIEGLQIGNGPVNNMVVSTHHGNEYGATEVAKGFAESAAEAPIAGQTLFVIPVLNIDGYNTLTREEIGSDQSSHDPNRDYPGPCGTEGPHKLKSTAALAQFVADHGIVASATLHTYAPVVAYPWGFATQDLSTPYDDIFKALGAAATQESQYEVGNSTETIYPAPGTYEDYAFWKHGIWSLLFELGDTHTPDDDEVKLLVAVNVPGLRRMMEQAPKQRATDHDFKGSCDSRMNFLTNSLDRHDE